MQHTTSVALLLLAIQGCAATDLPADATVQFDPKTDLISLHYDHAPDKDDGHSAAADRSLLQALFGPQWLPEHVVAVSGAYGLNAETFNGDSDAVRDAAWNDAGGWLAALDDREKAIEQLTARWSKTLDAGGDVWVKEGGQSDITAAVVERVQRALPAVDTLARIHVVQHSDWNENQTTPAALAYAKMATHYIRISAATSANR